MADIEPRKLLSIVYQIMNMSGLIKISNSEDKKNINISLEELKIDIVENRKILSNEELEKYLNFIFENSMVLNKITYPDLSIHYRIS